jgi:hypothetical protein
VTTKSPVQIGLYDVQGKMVLNLFEGVLNEGKFHSTIHRDQLNAGIYLLKMISGESIVTKKVVIE